MTQIDLAQEQEFLYKDLTYGVIGAAMEVHRIPGPGYLESVYEAALAHEFDVRGIAHHRQAGLDVAYKSIIAGQFRADFLVDGKVDVELKAIKALTEDRRGATPKLPEGYRLPGGPPPLIHNL